MHRLWRNTASFLFIALYSLLLVGGLRADITEGKVCWPKSWPWQGSDLTVDPDLTVGELANGFRYLVKENREPRGRVAVYLMIGAGSFHEEEEERGLAHYLEHMMFKGTKHYPPGTLVNYFQSIGMDFGADANAYTSFDKTVYKLFLPSGSEEELRRGLVVLTDFARHALLGHEQIKEERGVILSEKRARDSASYRTQVAAMEFAFRGTRLAERMVIGTEKTLLGADRHVLKTFYDTWYRPDNMVLAIVGDIDTPLVSQLTGEYFGSLEGSGSLPNCADFGSLAHHGTEVFYHYEPELGKTNVSIETFWQQPPEKDSLSRATLELTRILGNLILGYRLQRLQEREDVPFTNALYASGDLVERIGYGTISAQTSQNKWRETLTSIDASLRQAIYYGFDDDEVERAKSEVLSELDTRVQTANSEDSRKLAAKLLDQLSSHRVYQSPHQEKALYGPILKDLTREQINSAFRRVWRHDSRLVSVTGDARLEGDHRALLMKAYESLQEEKIERLTTEKKKKFPYLSVVPTAAGQPRSIKYEQIGVERVVFENGLVVNLKQTDFRENVFQVVASFGAGKQSEPAPGMAMIAEDTVNLSGTGTMTQAEVEQLLAGTSVNLRFRIGETALSWVGGGLVKDKELLIQLLHTALFDPGLRETRFALAMENAQALYLKKERDIEGAMALHITPFLAGGNVHFGLVPWESVKRITYEQLRQWMQASLVPRDLELTVVGDFQRDEILALFATYFSGVPLQAPAPLFGPVIAFPEGGTREVIVDTSIDKALLTVAWPTDDFWDIGRTRRLHVLAAILEDRVRKIVREDLGAAYSPSVTSYSSRVYPGYGYLIAQVLVRPGDEGRILERIKKIAAEMGNNGITQEELQRGKQPTLTSINDTIRSNGYWLSSVLTLSSRHPQQLGWPTTIVADFSAITKEEVEGLATRYLDNRRAAVGKAVPLISEAESKGG
jgi:zinc protease